MVKRTFNFGDMMRVHSSELGHGHPFTDQEDSTPVDPDTLSVWVTDPAGVETEYVYGDDVEVVRDAVGEYHIDIDANQSGVWYVGFYGGGDGQAADEIQLTVREPQSRTEES